MKAPKIVVIGSLNMDIVIEADRYPQQGETMLGHGIRFLPGGKGANQAVAAARLGAAVTMIGAVGTDGFGQELVKALQAENVGTDTVRVAEQAATGVASIYVCQGDNSIVVLPGANHMLLPAHIDACREVIAAADIVLLQMEIPVDTVAHAAQVAKACGCTVVLNPAPAQKLPEELLRNVDYITPNRTELALLIGRSAEGGELEAAMRELAGMGARHVITTLGAEGSAFMAQEGTLTRVPGYVMEVVDTTGAGDSFNAGLAYSLALGQSLEEAVSFAAKVSALAVTKFGAQPGMPTLQEVLDFNG